MTTAPVGCLDGEQAIRDALQQIVDADDAQALTQQHIEIARAALSASRQEGWQLVPVEPTDDMLKAGRKAIHDSHSVSKKALMVYGAMLAAAPHQSQEAQGDSK